MLVEAATDAKAAPAVEDAAPNKLARWHIRAAALAVDLLPGAVVVATMALVWLGDAAAKSVVVGVVIAS